MPALQQTVDLSRVYSASRLVPAGTGSSYRRPWDEILIIIKCVQYSGCWGYVFFFFQGSRVPDLPRLAGMADRSEYQAWL